MKKLFVYILLCILCLPTVAQHVEFSLDGDDWKFKTDPDSIGYYSWANGLSEPEVVAVPHTWNVDPKYERYVGTAWYEKDVIVSNEWKTKTVRLHFDAVYRDMVLYINGKQVGQNFGTGYTPISFDVTKYLNFGKCNKVVVSVCNRFSEHALPYKIHFDWTNDGGIIRPVKFIVTDGTPIRYAHIRPTIQFRDSSATASVRIKLWKEKVKKAQFTLVFSEWGTKKRILEHTITLSQCSDGTFETQVRFDKIKPWHFDMPNLYNLTVTLKEDRKVSDVYTTRFGFRKVEIKGNRLILNEEAMRLPGIEYMAGSVPVYGMAEPIEVQRKAVELMKNLNCVISRFHWQQDTRILDFMDEQGILVQEEIPWWQAPGNLTPEMEALAKHHIDLMIERDLNHPCIFSWGVSNEVFNNTDKNVYHRLIQQTRYWETSALVSVVSNQTYERLENDESLLADIPTWNDYVGTWYGKSNEETQEKLDLIYQKALNGRPLLITEHGLCEPHHVGGDARRIIDMAYHFDLWTKADYIMGCIYFSLNDYRTHMGEAGKGRFKQRVHGLTDCWLNLKPSYNVYCSLAAPLYIEKVHQDGQKAQVILKVKNTLPSYILRHYKLAWLNENGKESSMILPDLIPGDRYKVTIDRLPINQKLKLKVVRPTGFTVTEY